MNAFDDAEFDRARDRWERDTLPERCEERAEMMARNLIGLNDPEAFKYFRHSVRLLVHAMQLEILREPAGRAHLAPTRPALTADQLAFRRAMLALENGYTAYWPIFRAGITKT